jgi:sterol desaturase/sphingolipid hydroxylase (fatty acid hydroxylase superfamily)
MEALAIPAGIYLFFVLLDLVAPGRRRFPKVSRWHLKGALFFVLGLAVSSTAPLLWDAWLSEHRLIDARSLGTVGGAVVGFLAVELGVYAWHRTLHGVPVLWRWFHQMHHSAERVDAAGAFYFHPLDVAGFAFVGSLALVGVVGVTPEAAAIANTVVFVMNVFQHSTMKTPVWLGYFVQRPESHALHHERGVHRYNYSDLPIYDMVFGTFRNPATWSAEAGFYDGASKRVGAMLIGRDVSAS